ncbi:hypothetical protein BJ875DRAFT_430116 [Amylocarpus encephaloides]|uniref:holo-[acyl-carrier-protein] synthase n=1 Tax=Amylocarpus encephaloides TaxID=45428 RepID=A0A9P7YDZ0_9HELO|nr:hypothetical protein BJ875DRAFT_430116 [Amylocarpus encephaloides]
MSAKPQIVQWLLDTRPLWPVTKKDKPKDETLYFGLRTRADCSYAARALALLSDEEQASVLKYYHVRDAKMSLGSYLLKHLVVAQYCNISWSQTRLSRTAKGKPCYIPSSTEPNHVSIDFNVSHQAGIVSLIAAIGFDGKVDTGTDVVCINERGSRDKEQIDKSGFFEWVDIHAEVFAESEVSFMKLGPVSLEDLGIHGKTLGYGKDALSRCQCRVGKISLEVKGSDGSENVVVDCNDVIDAKLRRFYAMWCLREAYVKMTGEALLASWLKDLEILDMQAPSAKDNSLGEDSLEPGSISTNFQISFFDNPVTDVKMELEALGKGYMVGGALRTKSAADREKMIIGKWKGLDLEKDVLFVAERNP